MASRSKPRSILKQDPSQAATTLTDEQKLQAESNRRNLAIALHYANKIQHQKDIEHAILQGIELLLDFPNAQIATSANRSKFRSLLQSWQPSDLDSLIEERRIGGSCGYALCANPVQASRQLSSQSWKSPAQQVASDFCSGDCAKKAMYVKAQLNEVPAWEREVGQSPDIKFSDDESCSVNTTKARVNRVGEWLANNDELATERGESTASFRPKQVMADHIIEKAHVDHSHTQAPAAASELSYALIEGYEPRTSAAKSTQALVDSSATQDDYNHLEDKKQDETEDSWREMFANVSRRQGGT